MKTMKKTITSILILIGMMNVSKAQKSILPEASKVDFDAFEKLVHEVKAHRAQHLVSLEEFNKMSKQEKVIILDTRSTEMYNRKHVKGAIHLDFTDFTQANLAKIIPSSDYKILIYCNNNFDNDQVNFATKAYIPPGKEPSEKDLTLALNIPTYINLYGYGYKNVYELKELVNVNDNKVQFEGTDVKTIMGTNQKQKKYGSY